MADTSTGGAGVRRALGAAVVSLLGAGLFVPNALRIAAGGTVPGTALAGAGAVLSATLVLAGYLLVRAGFAPGHVLRAAGWATLGTVLLGLVLALIVLSGVSLPTFAAATLLSVSTFPHVVIGVRDVQRIRAEDLARQREKLAVLNRLVRHDLRHEGRHLLGDRGDLAGEGGHSRAVEVIDRVVESLTGMNDTLAGTAALVDRRGTEPVDLGELVGEVVAERREAHPEAVIEIDQLTHSRGVGLWFARWVVEAYGGSFDIDTGEVGTTVSLELRGA